MFFQYGDSETAYLTSKDKHLGRAIQQIGHINREVDSDLFSAIVHHIIGQADFNSGAGNRLEQIVERSRNGNSIFFDCAGARPAPTDWNDLQKSRLHSGFCEAGTDRHFEFGAVLEFER